MCCKKVVFLLGLVVFFSAFVGATSFRVTPSKYEMDFSPGLSDTFKFDFQTDIPNLEFEIAPRGDLVDYITFEPKTFKGSGTVFVNLKLPGDLEDPGKKRLLITARPLKSDIQRRGNIGVAAAVSGLIEVHVPYPGKYAEVDFSANDANAGEGVYLNLMIYSRGLEEITTSSRLEIYESGGLGSDSSGRENLVETIDLGSDVIPAGQSEEITTRLDTSNYASGNYYVVAVVSHDRRVVEAEDSFRLGELFVDISDYSVELERGKVDSVVVEVQSFWNDKIPNVFVTGEIEGYGDLSFQTPSRDLAPWGKERLIGYFDTSSVEEDELNVKLIAYYGDKTTEKEVEMYFVKGTNYLFIGLLIVLGIALIFFGWVVFDFIRGRRKRGRKK